MAAKESYTTRDVAIQTDPPPPPYTNAVRAEGIERLKRFLLYSLRREYDAEGDIHVLSFRESMQWNSLGRDPRLQASQDRQKFDESMDDFIEIPCKALGISASRVWTSVVAHSKNFFRASRYRDYMRESSQESPQAWAKKLREDMKLVDIITNNSTIRDALHKAIGKEVSSWFIKLGTETGWELTPGREAYWSWKRVWM